MMRYWNVIVLCLLALPLVGSTADAITVTVDSIRDNTLYESATGSLSNGAGQHFFTGRTGQVSDSRRRGLIHFDIAEFVPSGATIESVQLTLHMSKTPIGAGTRTVELRRVLEDWGEGASDPLGNEGAGTTAATDDATWVHTFFDTSTWNVTGGSFTLTPSAAIDVGGVGFYTWGSTVQMVSDVQGWLDDPSTNFGWLLLGDESTTMTAKRFDTHEHPTASDRPELVVEYSLPAQPPELDSIGPKVVDEGSTLNFTITASDPNGTIPDLLAENLPSGGQFSDNDDGTGDFLFTPNFEQSGLFNVRFIATDGALADTELVEITVNEVTDPPIASDDTVTTPEDQPVSDALAANDPDGDSVFFEIVDGPFHGSLTAFDGAVGTYTYDPSDDFFGEDSILFRANDGTAVSDTGLVIVTVTSVNDPPVAGDVNVSVSINTPINVGPMPVTDVDDTAWTITQTAGPFHGSVSDFDSSTGSFTYSPDLDYTGLDSILYIADDGDTLSDTATVRLTVSDQCSCPFQGDINADGVRDAVDLNLEISALFFNGSNPQDPNCPTTRADVNNDGVSDAVDLNYLIDVLFFNGPDPIDPCQP